MAARRGQQIHASLSAAQQNVKPPPARLARDVGTELVFGLAIPRNRSMNPQGILHGQQIGFGEGAPGEAIMLAKLEALRKESNPE